MREDSALPGYSWHSVFDSYRLSVLCGRRRNLCVKKVRSSYFSALAADIQFSSAHFSQKQWDTVPNIIRYSAGARTLINLLTLVTAL